MTIIKVIMTGGPPYTLLYDPEVKQHLRVIDAKHYSLIRRAIEEQLTVEPDNATRNREPLQRQADTGAVWELRFGPNNRFRVFHDVDHVIRLVRVRALGVKDRNRLLIGGEEVEI